MRGCHYDLDASGHVDVNQGREVLPTNVKPTNYDPDVKLDFDLDVVEDSTSVAVNSLDIDIKEVEVKHGGNIQKPTETSIKYVGDLNDNMAGFYRSSYKDQD
ncbi:Aminopeptidase 2 mitochondrial [Rhizina undulata]